MIIIFLKILSDYLIKEIQIKTKLSVMADKKLKQNKTKLFL